MCPLWPAHYLLMYVLCLGPLWLLSFHVMGSVGEMTKGWDVKFNNDSIKIMEKHFQEITMNITNGKIGIDPNRNILLIVDDQNIAEVFPSEEIQLTSGTEEVKFNITGKFVGITKVYASASVGNESYATISKDLRVAVLREIGPWDKAFLFSVVALCSIIFINMGAALDTQILIQTIRRPIGPTIGFLSQFLIMPLLSYGIGKAFDLRSDFRLGLFITGCSPGGGASNIWTLTLGGNLNLSITMTTISTFSAFFMMPLWMVFGRTIFNDAHVTVPYRGILNLTILLIVPLTIGILIQRFIPKVGKLLVKILKPFAIFLIIFIVVFAVFVNFYIFSKFTWQILMSGFLLPLFGYIFGGLAAFIFKQDSRDIVAIAVETGVQNTGLAIMALQVSLDQPEADLTTALPVAVAIMTPIFPILMLTYQRMRGIKSPNKSIKMERQSSNLEDDNPLNNLQIH